MYHIPYVYVYNCSKSAMKAEASGNKHQQRSEATRRKLLKSARRVFARDGFEAARIEDIAAQAGHTRGAFYANFSSKEDLFFALVEQLGRERLERIERMLECCSTAEERLAALREYYVNRIADRQWVMLLVEFKLFALRRGRHRARLAAGFRRARASVKSGALQQLLPERLHVSPDRVEAQKAVLEAILNGLVLEHAYDPLRLPEGEAASALGRFFDVMTGAP
jgi:AcrR family transcriptional regulator